MKEITSNEMQFVLTIFKNPEKDYNANSISKVLNISSMGALKIAKNLEKEKILLSRKMGKAKFYSINLPNDYTRHYLKFLLKRESEKSDPYIKRWVSEIRKIKKAESAILFGSLLKKKDSAGDIDVMLLTDQKSFQGLKKEIADINFINDKKLHPVFQTSDDLRENLKKGDKVLLNAIKGIFVFGESRLIDLIKNESR